DHLRGPSRGGQADRHQGQSRSDHLALLAGCSPRGARGKGAPLRAYRPEHLRTPLRAPGLGSESRHVRGHTAVPARTVTEGEGMNIAVMGGAGFVGSALSRRLIADGHQVTIYDNGSRGKNKEPGAKMVWAGIDGLPKGTELVYDLAAGVYGVRDLDKAPAALLAYNITLTTDVLKSVVAAKVPRYVYVSSSCVYDFPGAKVPHKEDDTNICDTSYGFSKLAGEQLAKWYGRQYGFSVKIARLFNVYGPGDSMQSPHVIPEFIKKAEAAKTTSTFAILGSGEQTRDFTYMDDVVAGLLRITERGADFEAYNVGTGFMFTINEIAHVICEPMGVTPQFVHEPAPIEDIQRRCADNEKLRALGWEPTVAIWEGVRRVMKMEVLA